MEAQGDYEGKPLTFLIDSKSLHSFISPSIAKRLQVEAHPTGHKLQVSLANGSTIQMMEQIVDLNFQLEDHSTEQRFRVLKMGKFEGILGMDWFSRNKADIHCSQGTLSFQSSRGQRVQVEGRTGKAPLKVVKISSLVKGLRMLWNGWMMRSLVLTIMVMCVHDVAGQGS